MIPPSQQDGELKLASLLLSLSLTYSSKFTLNQLYLSQAILWLEALSIFWFHLQILNS